MGESAGCWEAAGGGCAGGPGLPLQYQATSRSETPAPEHRYSGLLQHDLPPPLLQHAER